MHHHTVSGAVVAFAAAAVISSAEAGVVIDFDSFADGDVIDTQFPEATFSSSPGNVNFITAQPSIAHTPPNFICTGPEGGSINCVEDTYVDFTNPVEDLTLWAIGVNDFGVVAQVNVFVNNVFDSTVDILGMGDANTPFIVDLSPFSNVTRIELVNIVDNSGIGWDTFSFTLPTPGAMGVLALAGFAGTGARRRQLK
ncbi:MAG: hypothetical protein ACYS0D_12240 [Planctomycetota bacterium]|jgi:hypothetical protein